MRGRRCARWLGALVAVVIAQPLGSPIAGAAGAVVADFAGHFTD